MAKFAQLPLVTALVAASAGLSMAGCDRLREVGTPDPANTPAAELRAEAPREVGTPDPGAATPAAPGTTGATPPMPSDSEVLANVKAALSRDTDLALRRLDVVVVGGKVVLRGVVPSRTVHDHAVGVVAAVDGVVAIDDKLTLAAP